MSERNGPGGMNTERRSPIITSGVATPRAASNNITVVITTPATNPASKPATIAFVLLTTLAPSYKLIGIRESICAPGGRDRPRRAVEKRLVRRSILHWQEFFVRALSPLRP